MRQRRQTDDRKLERGGRQRGNKEVKLMAKSKTLQLERPHESATVWQIRPNNGGKLEGFYRELHARRRGHHRMRVKSIAGVQNRSVSS